MFIRSPKRSNCLVLRWFSPVDFSNLGSLVKRRKRAKRKNSALKRSKNDYAYETNRFGGQRSRLNEKSDSCESVVKKIASDAEFYDSLFVVRITEIV